MFLAFSLKAVRLKLSQSSLTCLFRQVNLLQRIFFPTFIFEQSLIFQCNFFLLFVNRFAASLFYVQRIDGSEHEGPFPLEHDRGAAPPSRRLDGGPVHQLPHHQALRRVPVLHKRNPVKK